MARLSASIAEETKDALYAAAQEQDQPVSHLVQAALDAYLGREEVRSGRGGAADLAPVLHRLGEIEAKLERALERPSRGAPPRFF